MLANEISLTLFPTLQGDSPWPNETILSGVPARHNFLFFFLGLREWNFTILLEKVTPYFSWNLFIGKKSVTDLFSRNQFRFNQFLSISFKVILLFPFHELKLFILQKSSSKTSESFPKKPFSNSSKRRFPKNHPSNFTFKFFLLSKFDLFSFLFRFQNPFSKISKERNLEVRRWNRERRKSRVGEGMEEKKRKRRRIQGSPSLPPSFSPREDPPGGGGAIRRHPQV